MNKIAEKTWLGMVTSNYNGLQIFQQRGGMMRLIHLGTILIIQATTKILEQVTLLHLFGRAPPSLAVEFLASM
jgi:hypothetical protein